MKKIKGVLMVLSLSIACLLLLTACSAKLSAPSSFRLDADTLTLHWTKVKGAVAYAVEIGEQIQLTTKGNTVSLENLEPGEYVVRVQAITYDDQYENSDFAEYHFTREQESGLRYKLNPTRDSYELVGLGTASGDIVMDDYYRGKPVTSIGKAALRRSSTITSFVVGKNVKTIGENAFYACTELTAVTIPEGVITIGKAAFQSCTKLENVALPSSVQILEPYAFSMCQSLKSVTMQNGVQIIGKYAFSDCEMLETAILSDSVMYLDTYVFSGCGALKQIQLGSQLQSIGQYAFYRCTSLPTIELNQQLQYIDDYAFFESGLAAVSVPDSVIRIGQGAFAACENLAEVKLGAGLQAVGYQAFGGTALDANCTDDVLRIDHWIVHQKNPSSEIELYYVPDHVVGIADGAFGGNKTMKELYLANVRYIGDRAFQSSENLWKVFAGNANVRIGEYAFSNCKYLSDITLGNGLKEIGQYAFYKCESLEDAGINLPTSLNTIGYNAFGGTLIYRFAPDLVYVDDWVVGVRENVELNNTKIKEGTRCIADYTFYNVTIGDGMIYMPASIQRIGLAAFMGCTSLVDSNLPAGLQYIGDYAFSGCANVWFGENGTTVIPAGCEYIGDCAFRDCTLLVGLTIPGTVKHIGNMAFMGCVSLGLGQFKTEESEDTIILEGEFLLGEGVETIGDLAFMGCIGLQEIVLPDSLKQLGDRAFMRCIGIKQVHFGSALTEIPQYAFYDCTGLQQLQIPGNVKSIGKYAFRGCVALEKVILNNGVQTVADYAFFNCESVMHLSIADSVTSIGSFAFRGMKYIQSICLSDQLTYVGRLAFLGAANATIYLEGTQIPDTWAARWNASGLPVVMQAVLSDDNSYVLGWTGNAEAMMNLSASNILSAPTRSGYIFLGWGTAENADTWQYSTLIDVPAGITVYSVWEEQVPEESELVPGV